MTPRWPVAFLLTSACTLNVASVDHTLSARTEGPFTTVGVDLSDLALADDLGLSVRGSADAFAVGTGRLVGLRGTSESEDALIEGWDLAFGTAGARVDLALSLPPNPRSLWLSSLTLDVPSGADVVLALGDQSAHASDLTGRIEAVASSGSMEIQTRGVAELTAASGSLEVSAAAGTFTTESGSIDFVVDGWVVASAASGSIEGAMGDGGSLETESGSIDVTLTAAPTRDLSIRASSGSIVLRVPEGAPLTLDVASEHGDVVVNAGALREEGDAVMGDLAGGGPLVHIRTTTGSIVVTH